MPTRYETREAYRFALMNESGTVIQATVWQRFAISEPLAGEKTEMLAETRITTPSGAVIKPVDDEMMEFVLVATGEILTIAAA